MIHKVSFRINGVWFSGDFDEETGTFATTKRKKDSERKSCNKEPKPVAKTVRWLGFDWEGTPWPKRIRLRNPFFVQKARGCGCLKTLKAALKRSTA